MSSSTSAGTTSAPAPGGGPAPAASTSPLPGSSPSSISAASQQPPAAGAEGAAPAAATTTTNTATAHQPTVEIESEDQKKNDGAIPTSASSNPTSESSDPSGVKPLPALPAPEDATDGSDQNGFRTVVVNGQAVALDNLGPMVVGRDGTVSRIANWPEMTEIERQNTLRILCKRNQLRLANLRAGLPADQKPAEEASSS
ncbi:hypothetical protein C8A03DRAFT_32898 [Achaetomium macrosporum]|uniref:Uncharacterized protein n=1 Tax=Achaetomium macrosporum TaxID=79813 RepID=A0AAN7HD05_9PEZI|nr:hypothetical protein C8A03DRAFT_32898 [Achaetomium macrosporum]